MKLQGHMFAGPNEEVLVLQRLDKELVFKARAVLNYDKFEALVPLPKPKEVTLAGGTKKLLWDDGDYKRAMDNYSSLHTAFTVLTSLQATPDLEWDTVDMENPSTWKNYEKELRAAFFTEREMVAIINLVWSANNLDENKLEEARKRFLATQAQGQEKQI